MAKPLLANVFSHWHKSYDGFQTSTLDFYSAVEAGLQRRQIPDLSVARVDFHEGGAVSAKREYVRITRKKLTFDLCAAPFGTGYFFSWWLGEKKPSRWVALLFLGVLVLAFLFVRSRPFRAIFGGIWGALAHVPIPYFFGLTWPIVVVGMILLVVVVFKQLARLTGADPEDAILAVPLVGPVYKALAKPLTYYRIDTILMYQSLVKGAVEEAIDGVTTAKGLRALTEDEKKPIMRDFLSR